MDQLYDKKAGRYDEWYQTSEGIVVDRIEKEAVMGYLGPRPGMSVLDIGCGTGNYSLALARLGLNVTGVDISAAMLARAREKAGLEGLKVEFIQADAGLLPFPGETFDAVISVTAMEFMPDLSAALREAFRALKPGGRLVVGAIGRDSAWFRFYDEKARRDGDSVFRAARFYTLEDLRKAMPGRELRAKAVLFAPPDFDFEDGQAAMELEATAVRAGRTDGGFICAVSVK